METVSFYDIPRPILASLLDMNGPAGDMSPRPLMGEAAPVTKHQLAELYAGGYIELPADSKVTLTPPFKRVAETLKNPATNVTFRLWGADNTCGETSLLFPGDIIDGEGVVLNQIDDNYRLAAPVETSDMLDLLRPAIPAEGTWENQVTFEGQFDVPVAVTLFGIFDLVRRNDRSAFTASQIYGYLDGQWGLTGFDCLISYVAVAGMMPRPPSLKEVEFALLTLLDAKMITENTSEQYSLADSLAPVMALLPETFSGLQWQRVSQAGPAGLLCSNRIFLICKDGFILSLSPIGKGRIFISVIRREALISFLLDEFMVTLPKPRTALNCTACGATVPTDKKFCIKCGKTMTSQEKPCCGCGEMMDIDKKFCTRCGAGQQ